jgi:hypothetical protein
MYCLLGGEQECLVVNWGSNDAIVCVAGVAEDSWRTTVSKTAEASVSIIAI